jgi:eukaryotic-like serine/threonine-protein kinase
MSDLALTERARQRVGSTLRRGKYSIERLLGVGAMGAVYEATHRNGMRVAIKVLHTEIARVEEVRQRFLREGYIANMVHHAALVRVLDDDIDDDGATFLVMELLDGRTLSDEWMSAGRVLPAIRVLGIAREMLAVLDAIHAAGIIHRDVKPENVFVTRAGPLKLLDLGIARLMIESRLTASGQIMGTPEFMAPEQAAGQIRVIGPKSDLYSLGAMMFTLLTGHPVHEARTPMEAMVFGATRPARPLRDLWPAAPPLLANAVDVALSFEPDRRWASAAEMRTALDNAARLLPPTASAGPPLSATSVLQGIAPTAPVTSNTLRLGSVAAESDLDIPVPLVRRGHREG